MADRWQQGHGDLQREAQNLSDATRQGAVLRVEVDRPSLEAQRLAGLTREREGALLARAWSIVVDSLPSSVGRREGWSEFHFVLEGARRAVTDSARELLTRLSEDREAGRVNWRLVLVELFLGEPERTFLCDPGYDLAPVTGSVVAWVEPYAGPDWRESQRYPAATILTGPDPRPLTDADTSRARRDP